jgi:carbon-monoxide dehydrogenase iron sulfur subunit
MKNLYYVVKKCVGCKTCELACAVAHSESDDLSKALKEKRVARPLVRVYGVSGKDYPVTCRHCKDPKCVAACMAKALTRDVKTGMVLHDEDRCVGCWMCVMVCPYGAIRPNHKIKLPLRCDRCKDKDQPACVKACPTKAILWEEEPEPKK